MSTDITDHETEVTAPRQAQAHEAEREHHDVDLRAAIAALDTAHRARDRYRTLYERAPVPYVTIDRGRRIVELNPMAEELFGAPREQLIGAPIDRYIEELRRRALRGFVEEVLERGHARSPDLQIERADGLGEPVQVMIDGVALPADTDGERQVVLALVDVTLRCAGEAARRRAQDEVLGFVSHDLRGPLNAIVLACDALRAGVAPAEAAECVGAIEKAAHRSMRLIRELLQVVHIESGALTLDRFWFDLGDLARVVCADHAAAAAAAGCELTCHVDDGELRVHADHDRIYQACANLIGNALTHAKGTPVEVSVRDGGAAVTLAVADQGPGIPAADQGRVFDRFRQGGRGRSGAGLGLAIVRGVVSLHGGDVRLTSQPGLGARFEITLPRGGEPPAKRPPSAPGA